MLHFTLCRYSKEEKQYSSQEISILFSFNFIKYILQKFIRQENHHMGYIFDDTVHGNSIRFCTFFSFMCFGTTAWLKYLCNVLPYVSLSEHPILYAKHLPKRYAILVIEEYKILLVRSLQTKPDDHTTGVL